MNMDLHLVDFYGINAGNKNHVPWIRHGFEIIKLSNSAKSQTLGFELPSKWKYPVPTLRFLYTPRKGPGPETGGFTSPPPADIPRILRVFRHFFRSLAQGFHQWLSMGGSRSVASVESFLRSARRCKTTIFHTIHGFLKSAAQSFLGSWEVFFFPARPSWSHIWGVWEIYYILSIGVSNPWRQWWLIIT